MQAPAPAVSPPCRPQRLLYALSTALVPAVVYSLHCTVPAVCTPCRPQHLLHTLLAVCSDSVHTADHSACWMHSLEGSDYYMRSLQGAVSTVYTPCRGKRLLNASV